MRADEATRHIAEAFKDGAKSVVCCLEPFERLLFRRVYEFWQQVRVLGEDHKTELARAARMDPMLNDYHQESSSLRDDISDVQEAGACSADKVSYEQIWTKT